MLLRDSFAAAVAAAMIAVPLTSIALGGPGAGSPEPLADAVRLHLVPAASVGEALVWHDPMEYVSLEELQRLVREEHLRDLDARSRSEAERAALEARMPADHLIRSASLTGSVEPSGQWCEATLELEIDLPNEGPRSVPVLAGSFVLGAVRVDGTEARIDALPLAGEQIFQMQQMQQMQQSPGGHGAVLGRVLRLPLQGPGRFRAEIQLATRVLTEGFYSVVRLGLPGVPRARLELVVPGRDVRAILLPPAKLELSPAGGESRTRLAASLAPSPDIALRWVELAEGPAVPEEQAGEKPEAVPEIALEPRLGVTSLHLFDAGERGLSGTFLARVEVRRAPVGHLELGVGEGVGAIELESPHNWMLKDPGPPGKGRRVRLAGPEKLQGDVDLRLGFEVPGPASGFAGALPAIAVSGAARQPDHVAVTRSANLELACTASAGVDAASLDQLPATVQRWLDGERPLFLFRRPGPAMKVRIEGKRYPDAPVLAALADRAEAWTLHESSGQVSGRIAYRLRSSGRETVTLSLTGYERTGLFLDGKPPAATEVEDGDIQVSLAGVRPGEPAVLELRFRGSGPPLGISGESSFRLPALDVPIRELDWDVHTPRSHKFTDFTGAEGLRTAGWDRRQILGATEPEWPSPPVRLRTLGLAEGAHPQARALHLSSSLSFYPLLMLLLFGGFAGFAARLVLAEGRGFVAAALAAALGTFLARSYVPSYEGGAAAITLGFLLYALLVIAGGIARWAVRPPRPPGGGGQPRGDSSALPPAAAAALLIVAATALSGSASIAGAGELASKAQAIRAEMVQQEQYLRDRLLKNRRSLEDTARNESALPSAPPPPPPPSASPAQQGMTFDGDLMEGNLDDFGDFDEETRETVPASRADAAPRARRVIEFFVPYTGPAEDPHPGPLGFVKQAELDRLRRVPREPEPRPVPPGLEFLEASYSVDIGRGAATARLEAVVDLRGEGWKSGSVQVHPATVTSWRLDGEKADGRTAALELQGQMATLRTVGTGLHRLTLELALTMRGDPREGQIAFGSSPAPVTRVEVRGIDPGSELLAGGPIWRSGELAETWLSGERGLSLGWRPRTVFPGAPEAPAITEADERERITVDSFTVLSPENGVIGLRCLARFTISDAGTRILAFRLPEGFSLLEVLDAGGGALGTVAEQADDRIAIRLPEKVRGNLVVEIGAERVPQEIPIRELSVDGPVFPGAERETGHVALAPEPGTDATAIAAKRVRGADAKEAPDYARKLVRPDLALVHSFQRPGYELRAMLERRRGMEMAMLDASNARAHTLLSGTGQSLHAVTYSLKNSREQFLRVELPDGGAVEAASVAGRPVKPARGGDGALLVPLPPSPRGPDGLVEMPVSLVYSTPSGPLGPYGSWRSSLPRVSVAVQQLTWELYLPEGYRFFRTGGELREAGIAGAGGAELRNLLEFSSESDAYGEKKANREGRYQAPAGKSRTHRTGLLGLTAPVPATGNGQTYQVRLLKSGAAPPSLEIFFAQRHLARVAEGGLFFIALLVPPMLLLPLGLAARASSLLIGGLLVLAGWSSTSYLGTSLDPVASGLSWGAAFCLLYALFTPVRRWRSRARAAAAVAAVMMIAMAPGLRAEDAMTQAMTQPATGTAASGFALVPFGEDSLAKALQSSAWRGLVPAALFEAATRPEEPSAPGEPAPPAAYTVSGARLDGDVRGETAYFTLALEIEVLREGHVWVPLVEGEIAPVRFTGDGALVLSGSRDYLQQEIRQGDLILQGLTKGRERIPVLPARLAARALVEGPGRRELKLTFVDAKPFEFRVLPPATCSVRVAFDRPGVDADVSGAVKREVRHGAEETVLEADLVPGEGFRIEGYQPVPAGESRREEREGRGAAGAPPPGSASLPARALPPDEPLVHEPFVSAVVRTDLSVGESLVQGFALIEYEVRRARVPTLELELPEGVRINKIEGPGGGKLPVPRLPDAKDGFHRVTLPAPAGFSKSFQMVLHFERALQEGATRFDAPLVRTSGTAFERGFVTIQRDGPVGVTVVSTQGIEEIAPDRLPFETTSATALAFAHEGASPRLELELTRHREAQMATVALDAMRVRAEYAESGAASTQVVFQVRRSSGRYLRVRLPEKAEMPRASRGATRLEVSREPDGTLLLPLDTAVQGEEVSELLLEYRGPDVELGISGTFTFELPVCDLPVTGEGASWVLLAPPSHRFYLDGSAGGSRADPLGIRGWRAPSSGRAYLLGPGERSAATVRFLSRGPAVLVRVSQIFLALICGVAATWVVLSPFSGGVALGILLLAGSAGALGLLGALYPSPDPLAVPLVTGILLGTLLTFLLWARWRWRVFRGVAAAVLLSTVAAAAAAEAPDARGYLYYPSGQSGFLLSGDSGWVYLQKSRIEELFRNLETPAVPKEPVEALAPLALVPLRSRLDVEVGVDDALVKASYTYRVLREGTHRVSLGVPGPILSVRVDGQPADFWVEPPSEEVHAVLQGAGKHRVEMRFRVPVTRVRDSGWLEWQQPRFPINRLELELPGSGRGVEIIPALISSTNESGGRTAVSAALRMTGSVFVRWFEKGEAVEEEAPPAVEARYAVETATSYELRGRRLSGRTQLRYTLLKGALSGLSVEMGDAAEILDVTGGGVKRWTRKEGGRVDITFDRFRSGTDDLVIEQTRRVEVPEATAGPSRLRIPAPLVRGAAAQSQVVALRAFDRLELDVVDPGPLRPIDPSELPGWMQGEGIPLAFRGEAGTASLEVSLMRGKSLETTVFEVPSMRLEVLPGPRGWLLSHLFLSARNGSRQHLEVRLPEGAVPLDCRVRGEPRKPGVTADGLLVPLVRSSGPADKLQPFPVEVTYLSQAPAPEDSVGPWQLPLPRLLDVPVARLDVVVTPPEGRCLAVLDDALSDSSSSLPLDRAARGLENALRLAGRSLGAVGGVFGRSSRGNVHSMLQRVAHTLDTVGGNAPPPPPAPGRSGARYVDKGAGVPKDMRERRDDRQERASFRVAEESEAELSGAMADEMMPQEAPMPASPKPTLVTYAQKAAGPAGGAGRKREADAYQALQRSLGDRGALPVGIRKNQGGGAALELQGSLFPAGGTPGSVTLLVYDGQTRWLVHLGLGVLAFFLTVLTLDWAVRRGWSSPFFILVTLLPMAGHAIEWRFGDGTLDWIVAAIILGIAGGLFRMRRPGSDRHRQPSTGLAR